MIIKLLIASIILFIIISIAEEVAHTSAEDRSAKKSPKDQEIEANYDFLA
jgi:large-conductance mechanosensitive channel